MGILDRLFGSKRQPASVAEGYSGAVYPHVPPLSQEISISSKASKNPMDQTMQAEFETAMGSLLETGLRIESTREKEQWKKSVCVVMKKGSQPAVRLSLDDHNKFKYVFTSDENGANLKLFYCEYGRGRNLEHREEIAIPEAELAKLFDAYGIRTLQQRLMSPEQNGDYCGISDRGLPESLKFCIARYHRMESVQQQLDWLPDDPQRLKGEISGGVLEDERKLQGRILKERRVDDIKVAEILANLSGKARKDWESELNAVSGKLAEAKQQIKDAKDAKNKIITEHESELRSLQQQGREPLAEMSLREISEVQSLEKKQESDIAADMQKRDQELEQVQKHLVGLNAKMGSLGDCASAQLDLMHVRENEKKIRQRKQDIIKQLEEEEKKLAAKVADAITSSVLPASAKILIEESLRLSSILGNQSSKEEDVKARFEVFEKEVRGGFFELQKKFLDEVKKVARTIGLRWQCVLDLLFGKDSHFMRLLKLQEDFERQQKPKLVCRNSEQIYKDNISSVLKCLTKICATDYSMDAIGIRSIENFRGQAELARTFAGAVDAKSKWYIWHEQTQRADIQLAVLEERSKGLLAKINAIENERSKVQKDIDDSKRKEADLKKQQEEKAQESAFDKVRIGIKVLEEIASKCKEHEDAQRKVDELSARHKNLESSLDTIATHRRNFVADLLLSEESVDKVSRIYLSLIDSFCKRQGDKPLSAEDLQTYMSEDGARAAQQSPKMTQIAKLYRCLNQSQAKKFGELVQNKIAEYVRYLTTEQIEPVPGRAQIPESSLKSTFPNAHKSLMQQPSLGVRIKDFFFGWFYKYVLKTSRPIEVENKRSEKLRSEMSSSVVKHIDGIHKHKPEGPEEDGARAVSEQKVHKQNMDYAAAAVEQKIAQLVEAKASAADGASDNKQDTEQRKDLASVHAMQQLHHGLYCPQLKLSLESQPQLEAILESPRGEAKEGIVPVTVTASVGI